MSHLVVVSAERHYAFHRLFFQEWLQESQTVMISKFCLFVVALSCSAILINAYKDPLVVPGRSVMIHLFEWKWTE